jgi:hypothetical protein
MKLVMIPTGIHYLGRNKFKFISQIEYSPIGGIEQYYKHFVGVL